MSEKNHKCYSKYIMSKTFIKNENTKIIIKLNNAYENFKIANLLRENAKVVNDEKSRNFQNITMLTTTIIKLQYDFNDVNFK